MVSAKKQRLNSNTERECCSREEFDRTDLSESSSLLNQLVYSTDSRKVSLMSELVRLNQVMRMNL